jgi:(1->4)-alpha-D-glucan 1-alpha-D-glucosylmutase
MTESTAATGRDQTEERGARIPCATYRFQFRPSFTFADAEKLLDYLHDLGISDVYASPILMAAPGSPHGYDVCDHGIINPDLGGVEGFDALAAALQQRQMGLLLDTVPNHMGIADNCNGWWFDVLENGPSSPYARYFDIEWHPVKRELDNKVLLPILEDQYGRVLEGGKLTLEYDDGAFYLRYYDRILPVNPRSYDKVLGYRIDELAETLGADDPDYQELQSILTAISYLPEPTEQDPARLIERNREKEIIKRRLATLTAASPRIAACVHEAVAAFNGELEDPASLDLLEDLINSQSYRPAFWRVAGEEINYRRFFDINTLAAIRVEDPEVFQATHALTLRLAAEGKVTGLRIDHPDGLWDPVTYFRRLQRAYVAEKHGKPIEEALPLEAPLGRPLPLYVVAEKILTENEPLPVDWAVHGTTGYDFLSTVNGLFVQSANEKAFNHIYNRFVGPQLRFSDMIVDTKMAVMRNALSSEINALGHEIERIAERNRRYRDFTLRGLTHALRELISCLTVYRTYINASTGMVSARDRHFIETAVHEAQRRYPGTDPSVYRFVQDTLLLKTIDDFCDEDRDELQHFVMKFQQLTGPVMAKGVEDTAFYIYNRLTSLNEVGGDPRQFGISAAEFHRQSSARATRWPHSLLATSTHDNKRSEDARARVDVLSEIPVEWRAALARWGRVTAGWRARVGGSLAPDRNDEYLLYQVIIGTLTDDALNFDGGSVAVSPAYRDRIVDYMAKATKEAKVHSSWVNPNEEYDNALRQFILTLLRRGPQNRFLPDIARLTKRVAFFGQFNSLAQVLLKFTAPGVPDTYQGNELWDFSLVDPDNRRPVDYDVRRAALADLRARAYRDGGPLPLAEELLQTSADGRIKLYLTYRALNFRRDHCLLYERGTYHPLTAEGAQDEHALAFARILTEEGTPDPADAAITVVPRLVVGLLGGIERAPIGDVWGETWLPLPDALAGATYRNVLTGETMAPVERAGRSGLLLAHALAHFPVALLAKEG